MSSRAGLVPRVVAVVAVMAVVLTACGGKSPTATPRPARPGPAPARLEASAAAPGSVDALPSLDALAARGPSEAPLMRELLRVERAAPRSPDVHADADLCVRALLAASRPVRAYFADGSGAARGETTRSASGSVPPHGPACARKGETLHLVIESDVEGMPLGDASARAVIFAAP